MFSSNASDSTILLLTIIFILIELSIIIFNFIEYFSFDNRVKRIKIKSLKIELKEEKEKLRELSDISTIAFEK